MKQELTKNELLNRILDYVFEDSINASAKSYRTVLVIGNDKSLYKFREAIAENNNEVYTHKTIFSYNGDICSICHVNGIQILEIYKDNYDDLRLLVLHTLKPVNVDVQSIKDMITHYNDKLIIL